MMKHGVRALAFAALVGSTGTSALAERVYAVTQNQTLISFDSATPGTILSGTALWNTQSNERIRGIDFRPSTNELFALGSFSNLYTINLGTGMATRVGGGSFTPSLNGSSFGFDFNPTIDRIRVVSDANQNLVLNPNTGAATNATPLFYAAGDVNQGMDANVVGSAYNNNFVGAATSQLFGLDTGLDVLVRQANSAGTLTTVGPLGVNISDTSGFDISGATGVAYASVQDAQLGQSTFWTVNLNTGAATMVGAIGGGAQVDAIAVTPAPGAAGLMGLASVYATRRRRVR
jgi:hypothetical protein